ncbi:DNA-directed RNA polymerase subunit alpha [Sulfuriroseicoccus oceanibius]|uniref:DNA-directed RNA polymerase subunit alpha n=1 Tax=Sulfuriroseicoccus oceanibius TaxID=2707525 RepID=A0A6B3L8K2_9BACT|nr:DNA-directed RNA polymerase subunit alpha [Sulfuriroseicoccus oceanibius]QQL43774.1 DNA-directed RNA polymerase subunit alpha [Sulfuriroseicoccus oceanibius]
MSTTLARFELPNRLVKNEDTATDTFATFVAEPFESGFGHTIGNSLRRVLLSSLEGAAITSVKIAGAQHEFTSLPGVVEDVTEIILNLKKVKFSHNSEDKEPRVLTISVDKEGAVTAGDITEDNHYGVINKDQVICHLDRKTKFEAELEVRVGRGFNTGEENKTKDMPIGVIAIDSIFSPVIRVKYAVENTRVGQKTDYDKLILELWTDGRIEPSDAVLQASAILRKHLDVFVNYDDSLVNFDEAPEAQNEENAELKRLLNMSVNEIELSVRAANCLNNANITSVGQLAMKTEAEMLRYRNFGKKSLNEIKEKLSELGLSLGMNIDSSLMEGISSISPLASADTYGGLADLINQNLDD